MYMDYICRRELLKRGSLAAGSAVIFGTLPPSFGPECSRAQLGGPMDFNQIERLTQGLIYFVNAHDGVDPTGVRDSTVGIQSVLDAVPNGGGVVVFHGKYLIGAPLRPKDGTALRGPGWSTGSDPNAPAQLLGTSMTRPVIERVDDSRSVTIEGLVLRGNPRSSTSVGIHVATGYNWIVRDALLLNFGGPAIDFDGGGYGSVFSHVFAQGLTVRSGWSGWTGVLRVGGSDCRLDFVEAQAGTNNDLWAGVDNLAAFCIRGSFHLITNCIGEYSAVGFVFTEEPSGQNLVMNSRGEFNNGHGWVIDQPMNSLVQCHSICNSRAGDNLYDGFVICQAHNTLVACRTYYHYQYPTRHRYGFVEQLSDPEWPSEWTYGDYTLFLGCRNTAPPVSGEYYFGGTGQKAWIGASNRGVEIPSSCIRVASGEMSSRPSASSVGQAALWYDTTLQKPIWSDGANWRDSTGALV